MIENLLNKYRSQSSPYLKRMGIFVNIGLLITLLSLIFIAYNSSIGFQNLKDNSSLNMQISELQGEVLHLDEVLTMSARMAAMTGDNSWEQRYLKNEPKLDNAISTLLKISPEAANDKAVKQTNQANIELVKMEKAAFDLIRNGNQKKAREILLSPNYKKQKELYTEGMERFHSALQSQINENLSLNDTITYTNILFIVFTGLLIFVSWLVITFILSKIRDSIEKKHFYQLNQTAKLSSLGTMASGICHELNNPLGIIKGYSQKLLMSGPNQIQRSDLNRIITASERMTVIIEHLTLFARESTKSEKEKSYDIVSILKDSLILFKTSLKNSNIEIVFDETSEFLVRCDRTQIESVFQNLINNSKDAFKDAKLNSSAKKITVDFNVTSENMLQIVYKDNAGGMPKEVLDKIFEPFFTTKPQGNGTGLGMSISHGIIKDHSGEMSVESVQGDGTTFYIELPLEKAVSKISETKSKPLKIEQLLKENDMNNKPKTFVDDEILQTKNDAKIIDDFISENGISSVKTISQKPDVLVIDDEEALCDLISFFLAEDFNVSTCFNPEIAMEKVINGDHDIIVTDLNMPTYSGLDIIKAAQTHSKRAKVIVTSGYAEKSPQVQEAMACGAAGFLSKPFTGKEEIVEKLRAFSAYFSTYHPPKPNHTTSNEM